MTSQRGCTERFCCRSSLLDNLNEHAWKCAYKMYDMLTWFALSCCLVYHKCRVRGLRGCNGSYEHCKGK
jgi:hypothetical protein